MSITTIGVVNAASAVERTRLAAIAPDRAPNSRAIR
jgi:hypothetical protein